MCTRGRAEEKIKRYSEMTATLQVTYQCLQNHEAWSWISTHVPNLTSPFWILSPAFLHSAFLHVARPVEACSVHLGQFVDLTLQVDENDKNVEGQTGQYCLPRRYAVGIFVVICESWSSLVLNFQNDCERKKGKKFRERQLLPLIIKR